MVAQRWNMISCYKKKTKTEQNLLTFLFPNKPHVLFCSVAAIASRGMRSDPSRAASCCGVIRQSHDETRVFPGVTFSVHTSLTFAKCNRRSLFVFIFYAPPSTPRVYFAKKRPVMCFKVKRRLNSIVGGCDLWGKTQSCPTTPFFTTTSSYRSPGNESRWAEGRGEARRGDRGRERGN